MIYYSMNGPIIGADLKKIQVKHESSQGPDRLSKVP